MSDLTILLTLKGRKKFTKRWLDWMVLDNCSYKIILADGDEDKNYTVNLINEKKYRSLDIKHIKYPFDKDVNTFIKKMADVSKEISTKYVIHTDNDDFIFNKNLEKAIKYFERNQKIGTLALPHYRFKINNSDGDMIYSKKGSEVFFQRLNQLNNKNLLSKKQSIRLKESIKIFPSDFIHYGIHKSQDFRKIHNDLLQIVIDDLIFQEWYVTYIFPMLGIIECPKELDPFIVRQEGTSSVAKIMPKLSEYIMRPNWSFQLENMKLSILRMSDNESKDLISNVFDHSFLEMMMMVNTSAKIGSYLNRYKFIYNVFSSLYLKTRGKGRTDISHREIKKDLYLNKLTQFLKR